jgi:hypothetical protein
LRHARTFLISTGRRVLTVPARALGETVLAARIGTPEAIKCRCHTSGGFAEMFLG